MAGPPVGCLFCRIADGSVPAALLHADELVIAFRDIAPRAPTHILLVPRRHISSALELTETDGPLLGRLFGVAADLARSEGIADGGFRLVNLMPKSDIAYGVMDFLFIGGLLGVGFLLVGSGLANALVRRRREA